MMGVMKEPSIQSIVMPNVTMPSVIKLSVFYDVFYERAFDSEHCYAKCRYANCHNTECLFYNGCCERALDSEHRYAECCYAKCHNTECLFIMGVVKEPSIQSIVMPNVAMPSVIILSVFL